MPIAPAIARVTQPAGQRLARLAQRWRTSSLVPGALLLAALATPVAPAHASRLVVPDDHATIQGALDALPDTVLVRSGSYPETPRVFAKVALLGIPGDPAFQRPVLTGMAVGSSPGQVAEFLVRDFKFIERVEVRNEDGGSVITLERCHLQAGIRDLSDHPSSPELTLRGCELEADALLAGGGGYVIDSCFFRVSQVDAQHSDSRLTVTHSEFRGVGPGTAILGRSDIASATITGNVIRGYSMGVVLEAFFPVLVEDNVLRDLRHGGIFVRADLVRIVNNRVEGCRGSDGIGIDGKGDVFVANNTIADCAGSGLFAYVGGGGSIVGNVAWGNGGAGIHVGSGGGGALLEVRNNTCSNNVRSGFLSECSSGGRYEFTGNIGFANGRHGVEWGTPEVTVVGCNTWFGNGLGAVSGLPMSGEDRSVDPLFCDAANGDFRLVSTSPLVNPSGCGPVGALGVGCTGRAKLALLGPNPSRGPVRIEFELGAAGAIEIDVYDVQGRRLVSLAHGAWPAGRHAVEWAGRSGGAGLPVGLYLVRYRYPGGEDRRRIVLTP